MTSRYPGGFVTRTSPTVSISSASGIWTQDQVLQYVKAGTWPFTESIVRFGITASTSGQSISVDSSGNYYVCGEGFSVNPNGGFQSEAFGPRFNILWQNYFFSSREGALGIDCDDSGNVYTCGRFGTDSGGSGYLTKRNSSGTLQWQRHFSPSSFGQIIFNKVAAVKSSGTVYVVGHASNGSARGLFLVKYNTSGTFQWQRQIGADSNNADRNYGYGVAIDSSENIYVSGDGNGGGIIAKYNSSGTLQWARNFGASGGQCAVDTSGNVYVAFSYGGSYWRAILAKWNSSGTIQWQRQFSGSFDAFGTSVAIDSTGNPIMGGTTNVTSGYYKMFFVKWNSSGTIQWQRFFRPSSGTTGMSVAQIVSNGNNSFTPVGTTSASGSTSDVIFGKFPTDGSKTGTVAIGSTSFTYESSALTESAGAYSEGVNSYVTWTPAHTESTPSYTFTTSTFTTAVGSL